MGIISKNWSAFLDLSRQNTPKLVVSGHIQTKFGSMAPEIIESAQQGILAQSLYLILNVSKPASKYDEQASEQFVKFTKTANQGQYTDVTIFCDDEAVITLNVE